MSLLRVTSVDYTVEEGDGTEEVIVKLAGRDIHRRRRTHYVHGTEPWMFSPADEPIPDTISYQGEEVDSDEVITGVEYEDENQVTYESYDGKELRRIITHTPKQAGAFQDEFSQAYEADIPYYRRVSMRDGLSGYIDVPETPHVHLDSIDTNPDVDESTTISPRVMLYDIEVLPDATQDFEEMVEEAEQPVTNITCYDPYTDSYTCLILNPDEDDYDFDSSQLRSPLAGEWHGERTADIDLEICPSEQSLVKRFIEYMKDLRPDLVSAWNGVSFDWTYLMNYIQNFHYEYDDININNLSDIGGVSGWTVERKVDCLPAFDMMDAMKKMSYGDRSSWALDYVAEDELGYGKMNAVSVFDGYKNDRERLAAYNIIDVKLLVDLDEKEGVHEFFYHLAEMSGIQISDTFSEMRQVDGYIMSRRGPKEILPCASEKDIPENAGGLVLEPHDGIEEWTGVFDLKSLYPSSIISWNISPETLTEIDGFTDYDLSIPHVPDPRDTASNRLSEDDIEWDWLGTSLEEQGILPKYLSMMFQDRNTEKAKRNSFDYGTSNYEKYDNRQRVVKIIMNSCYGIASNNYWRLATSGMGDAITSAARYTLWTGVDILREQGMDVLYGDTDSVFVSIIDEDNYDSPDKAYDAAIETGERLEDYINDNVGRALTNSGLGEDEVHPHVVDSDLDHGTDRHVLMYEFEKLYRRFLQTGSKKRYSGLKWWNEGQKLEDPEVDVTGYESVRSDTIPIARDVQPEVLERILRGDGFDDISSYLRDIIQSIEDGTIDLYKIGMPKSIKRELSEYKTTTETVRAVRYSNQVFNTSWSVGDSPWVYYVQSTPAMTESTDVIALDWTDERIPDGYELDTEKIVEKAIQQPLDVIIEAAGYDFQELRGGKQSMDGLDADWGSVDTGESDDDWGTTGPSGSSGGAMGDW